MVLLRISGHSGAGKGRLRAELARRGILCPQAILYTSRPPRTGEAHGREYYFLSRGAITALPEKDFFVGPVRNMLQAVDMQQLEMDLQSSDLVLIEIFHGLWSGLTNRLADRLGNQLRTASVFMTAVDPNKLRSLPNDQARAEHIRTEIERILRWRGKDTPADIKKRGESAVHEILEAAGPEGPTLYSKILHSAPEGPDKQDDWTKEEQPVGNAKSALEEFIRLVKEAGQP